MNKIFKHLINNSLLNESGETLLKYILDSKSLNKNKKN